MTAAVGLGGASERVVASLGRRRSPALAITLGLGIVVGAAAVLAFDGGRADVATPNDQSVEAGFARDMIVHHTQAVELADRLRRRTADEGLALIATDMVLTQQTQIGRMLGWLDQWELKSASVRPPMAWMGMAGEAMPGMARPPEVAEVSSLPVAAAEVRFLELMIAHHLGGVTMAEAAVDHMNDRHARALARQVIAGQTSEIDVLVMELNERGVQHPRADTEQSATGHAHPSPTGG